MRVRVVIAVGVLGLSYAAWWGARSDVIGTEPPVAQAASVRVSYSETSSNAQVLVKVRILEADREAVNDVWKQFAQSKAESAQRAGEPLDARVIDAIAMATTGIYSEPELSLILTKLSKHAGTKVVGEPSITVLSGRTASFITGGEIGDPSIIGVGSSGHATTLRSVGISTIVKPTALEDGGVQLKVICESNQFDKSTSVPEAPGLNSRRVNPSLMLLKPGQSVVLFLPASDVGVTQLSSETTPDADSKKASEANDRRVFVVVTPEVVKPLVAGNATPQLPHGVAHVLTPYSPVPPGFAEPISGRLLQVDPPFSWPPAFPTPLEITRLQHLQTAKSHLEIAGMNDQAEAVQKEIKLEERSVAQRELQRRERELERLQTELESLRRSLSEKAE